jgi:exopolysaccharide/PEP-CTERM locus tyrosine autokinase
MSFVEKALKKLQDAHSGGDNVVEPIRADVVLSAGAAGKSDKLIKIDQEALRISGLMAPVGSERRLASEYRQIKRPLLAAAFGKGMPRLPNGRAIMVASALPGEGKTFTSVNLAMSMALEKDTSVVLVDADVAKPHISRTFGVENEPGLLEILREDTRDVESAIIPTTFRGLSILPAGRNIETATELLASARMEHMLAELVNRDANRIYLFDSPPLLLTSESRVLAGAMGQIVIVVRAESTLRRAVYEALGFLGDHPSIGLVLNQSESAPPEVYYGYGDYYSQPSSTQAGTAPK